MNRTHHLLPHQAGDLPRIVVRAKVAVGDDQLRRSGREAVGQVSLLLLNGGQLLGQIAQPFTGFFELFHLLVNEPLPGRLGLFCGCRHCAVGDGDLVAPDAGGANVYVQSL